MTPFVFPVEPEVYSTMNRSSGKGAVSAVSSSGSAGIVSVIIRSPAKSSVMRGESSSVVIRNDAPESESIWFSRSVGYEGSIGRYAAPDFRTPIEQISMYSHRRISTAGTVSGPMPSRAGS